MQTLISVNWRNIPALTDSPEEKRVELSLLYQLPATPTEAAQKHLFVGGQIPPILVSQIGPGFAKGFWAGYAHKANARGEGFALVIDPPRLLPFVLNFVPFTPTKTTHRKPNSESPIQNSSQFIQYIN